MAAERVVVIGASAAGLFAAAAASAAGSSVVVLERDELPEQPRPRSGVPQGRQPHVFLYRGLQAAEQLLPGLRADLHDAGAVDFDTADLAWLGELGWMTREATSFRVFSTTRPLLEHIIRRRVADLSHLEIRTGSTVIGLAPDGDGWSVSMAGGRSVPADLMIDAAGRNSRLPQWLAERYPAGVDTTEIDVRIGYATREFVGDPGLGDIPGVVLLGSPGRPVGGLALPVEHGRWLIEANGVGEHRPPRDNDGFTRFLESLQDPSLAALARRMEPVTDTVVHRQTGNLRRHYEQLPDWPDGLLVTGDAFCAFNPIYGQGIAVAACEAVMIRDELRAGLKPGGTRKLLRRFADVVALPWSIATSTDLKFQPDDRRQPTGLAALSDRWVRTLSTMAAHGNVRAASTLGGVYHLMAPSRDLLHPALVGAGLLGRIRGFGPAVERPAGLPTLS